MNDNNENKDNKLNPKLEKAKKVAMWIARVLMGIALSLNIFIAITGLMETGSKASLMQFFAVSELVLWTIIILPILIYSLTKRGRNSQGIWIIPAVLFSIIGSIIPFYLTCSVIYVMIKNWS